MKPTISPPFPGKASERSLPNPVPFPGVMPHTPAQPAPAPLSLSAYDAQTWVGRDDLIADLTQKLESGYRILALTGMTGIGKTALAERLVVNVQGQGCPSSASTLMTGGRGVTS